MVNPSRSDIADMLGEAASCREALTVGAWADGAPAAIELTEASEAFRTAVDRLIGSVDLWMCIATDQLVGISAIVRHGESMFGLFPLLRSVIEHSAYVIWVLDNQVDTRTRAARAALAALASQDALTGVASRMGGRGSETHRSHQGSVRLLRRDVEAEFDVALGEPYAIDAERLPRVTEIIEHFGERWGDPRHWVGLYGYLCGTANHPSLNAYEYLDLADPTAHPPRLSIELLSRLLRPVMVSYLKALEATTSYMGLPDEPTHHFIDRVNAVLGPTLIEPTLGRL